MVEGKGRHIIRSLQKRWMWNAVVLNVLLSVSFVVLLLPVLHKLLQISYWWGLPLFIFISVIVFLINRSWKISALEISRFLDVSFPELEESAGLVLKPRQSMNFLEQLQLHKTEQRLESIDAPNPLKRKSLAVLLFFLLALVAGLLLLKIPFRFSGSTHLAGQKTVNSIPEKILPGIKSVNLVITPPAYTGKALRKQDRFNLQVEENGQVKWEIQTNIPTKEVQLHFNDSSVLKLQSVNKEKTRWAVQKLITKSGFYQVSINGQLSELYKIEMIKDKVPAIVVQSPKSGSIIENGQPQQVPVIVTLADDYGISATHIAATVASGSGEAVKFKAQQLPFTNFLKGRLQYQLQQRLDLKALGMQPGDELYLYISATDNHGQESRSDIFIVTIQDTAILMDIDGLVNGLNIKPEFFRSQRQIIMETEQLIKDRDTMTVQQFNNKSNELGIDQKLLRLRYGKFLGEESKTEIGGDHDNDEGVHNEANDFGNAEKILDQFAHKHDIAEDATFFDAETKKQLKATLAEMWKAEGKLRIYKPSEALPFEYKALRLLKDLQQKSRVYVAKTSFKTTPLNPAEKRLTGDLSKIGQPFNQQDFIQNEESTTLLRSALSILEQLKNESVAKNKSFELLERANQQLSAKAAANPAKYLSSLEAFRRILNKTNNPSDIEMVQKALQQIIPVPGKLPSQTITNPPSKLSAQYFNNLKSSQRQ